MNQKIFNSFFCVLLDLCLEYLKQIGALFYFHQEEPHVSTLVEPLCPILRTLTINFHHELTNTYLDSDKNKPATSGIIL